MVFLLLYMEGSNSQPVSCEFTCLTTTLPPHLFVIFHRTSKHGVKWYHPSPTLSSLHIITSNQNWFFHLPSVSSSFCQFLSDEYQRDLFSISRWANSYSLIDIFEQTFFCSSLVRQIAEPVQWQSVVSKIYKRAANTRTCELGAANQLKSMFAKYNRRAIRRYFNFSV